MKMKPSTIWIAIVLLALGVCGILDAAGVVASSQTIGQWWPLAVVGWALAAMLDERRVTLGGVICAAIGLTLLAEAQAWANGAFLWSSLAIAIGLVILVNAALRRVGPRNGDASTKLGRIAS
jgi:sugar phosphate permease